MDTCLLPSRVLPACCNTWMGQSTDQVCGSRHTLLSRIVLCAICSAWESRLKRLKEAVMKWSRNEINRLLPILEQISSDLAPVDGKNILVLCSGTGEVAFWLGEMMEQGHVTGFGLVKGAPKKGVRSANRCVCDQSVPKTSAPGACHHWTGLPL